MCRTAGRRCTGASCDRDRVAARVRLHRARHALAAAEGAGDTAAAARARARIGAATPHRVLTMSLEELRHPVGEPRPLGGAIGSARLLEYADGTRVVHKTFPLQPDEGERSAIDRADAEELAPKVLAAVGLRTAAVRRASPGEVYIEYIDGKPGTDLVPWGSGVPDEILDSEQGRMLGLADAEMCQWDRNAGNWIVDSDGNIVAVDHDSSFEDDWHHASPSPFTRYLCTDTPAGPLDLSPSNDLSRSELTQIGKRLAALEPAFSARGRRSWWTNLMQRHVTLLAGARGKTAARPA